MENVRCTICNSDEVFDIPNKIRNDEAGQHKMYRCQCCETHFLYPRPGDSELQTYYDGKFREEVHSEAYYDYESLQRVFNSFFPEAKTRVERVFPELRPMDDVLEIGCSVGYFLSAISPYVSHVCGTEWDGRARKYIQDCAQEANIEVACNPEDFNRRYDKIFMFHVLEHIEEPAAFLQGLKEQLKPGGAIYIEVPNVDDILVKTYNCNAFKDFYYKKAHLYNFNEKGLTYGFGQAGYQYEITFIQRYDLSNHLYWLGKGRAGGKGIYSGILGQQVNKEYVKALQKNKQTDTLFAKIWV